MSGKKPLLLVNPNAGGGRARRVFPDILPVVERSLGPCDVLFTERSGHGVDLVRTMADSGVELVIAVGGDGTLNEVANGVLTAKEPKKTAIGFIGQGTGGDFRRTLGIEHRLDRYVEAIASGRVRTSDVGKVVFRDPAGETQSRFFLNILSAGMGGLVDRYVADASRTFGSAATYFLASLRALGTIERGRLTARVTAGGAEREEKLATYMIAICNGSYFGSGMKVAPMAAIDDGRFEVVSIGGDDKIGFALAARSIYSGDHLAKKGTVHFTCEKLGLALENEKDAGRTFLLDCDGEPVGGLPILVEMVPGALNLRA